MKLKKFFSPRLRYVQSEESLIQGKDFFLNSTGAEKLFQLALLKQTDLLGCILLSVRPFLQGNSFANSELRFEVVKQFAQECVSKAPGFLPFASMLFGQRIGVHSVLMFFSLDSRYKLDFLKGAGLLRLCVRDNLHLSFAEIGLLLEIEMGCSTIHTKRPDNAEHTIFKAISDAMQHMATPMESTYLPLHEELKCILDEKNIPQTLEPLVELGNGNVLGWEAVFSLPQASNFQRMESLLLFAVETGLISELNQNCLIQSLDNAPCLNEGQRLFLNLHPEALQQNFSPDPLLQKLSELNLEAKNVVLQVTDTLNGFHGKEIVRQLQEIKKQGFSIGLDNLNVETLKLHLLTQLRPECIKLRLPAQGVVDNSSSSLLIRELLAISEVINAKLIVEGINSPLELGKLTSMGVYAGKGTILTESSCLLPDNPQEKNTMACANTAICRSPVGDLAVPACTVSPETPVSRIQDMLHDQAPLSQVVVVSNLKPVGLIMKYTLDDQLSTQFGLALYMNRPIAKLMDTDFLQVEADQALEDVARKAMKRPDDKLYDDIVVTRNGDLYGLLSVQRMLDTMAQVQLELAKGANPLTGLPGNVAIETTIERLAKEKASTSLAYVDLDNFKVYNDVYGFENGDRIIRLTAKVLSEALKIHGENNDLLAHVGGDDFVIIAGPDHIAPICQSAIDFFAKEIPEYYNEEDRERGFIVGTGRDGIKGHFELVSLSIGILDDVFNNPFSMSELSVTVAKVKKNAKAVSGNSCVRECAANGMMQ